MIDIIWDMETSDPDDVMTLCLLMSHPKVRLCAVTVVPGTNEQIGLVKMLLAEAGLQIPVGSCKPHTPKNCVAPFYKQWLGNFPDQNPDGIGADVITETLEKYPQATILTGAPLRNFSIIATTLQSERWVAQGGFAGDNVVPEAYRLDKFKGKNTCATFNFNGEPKAALDMLANPNIKRKILIAKNVCHGVVYNAEWHEHIAGIKNGNLGLEYIYKGMEIYLKSHPDGKKFHDPLAAIAAIDESVCEYRQVRLYRERGEWGSTLAEDTNTFIAIAANMDVFWANMEL